MNLASFDAGRLEGTWHVLATNFPMWLAGDKTQPTFSYRLRSDGQGVCLDDVVTYLEDGKSESIKGVDTQSAGRPAQFTWRGKGLLWLFKSKWEVVATGRDDSWVALHFSSTLATPEGVDVIARATELTPEQRSEVDAALRTHQLLLDKGRNLKWLR